MSKILKGLLEFGFDEGQASTLMTKGKIDTPHGIYTLKNDVLTLVRHSDKTTKEYKLLEELIK